MDDYEKLTDLIARASVLVGRLETAAGTLGELSRFTTALELMFGAGWEHGRRMMPLPRRRRKRDVSHLRAVR